MPTIYICPKSSGKRWSDLAGNYFPDGCGWHQVHNWINGLAREKCHNHLWAYRQLEWTGSYLGLRYPDQVCALYKKIKSPWLNALMHKRRMSHVNYLIETKQMGELLRLIKTKPVLILMIADQNPGSARASFGRHY